MKPLKRTRKRLGCDEETVTDRLSWYGAALKDLIARDPQETGRRANNHAENSHQPNRRRERAMLRFRRMRVLQKSVAAHIHFKSECSLLGRDNFKATRTVALTGLH